MSTSDFDHNVAAAALFFNNGYNKAIRVEAPGIAMEFTDGLYIGKGVSSQILRRSRRLIGFLRADPEGILYYNAIDDFKMKTHDGTAVTHHYKVTTPCTIEFKRDSDTDCYAKVICCFSCPNRC